MNTGNGFSNQYYEYGYCAILTQSGKVKILPCYKLIGDGNYYFTYSDHFILLHFVLCADDQTDVHDASVVTTVTPVLPSLFNRSEVYLSNIGWSVNMVPYMLDNITWRAPNEVVKFLAQ